MVGKEEHTGTVAGIYHRIVHFVNLRKWYIYIIFIYTYICNMHCMWQSIIELNSTENQTQCTNSRIIYYPSILEYSRQQRKVLCDESKEVSIKRFKGVDDQMCYVCALHIHLQYWKLLKVHSLLDCTQIFCSAVMLIKIHRGVTIAKTMLGVQDIWNGSEARVSL